MMKSLVISYDEDSQTANIYDTEMETYSRFSWNDKFELTNEVPESDCEDFNDTARWLMKSLLAILKMEKEDSLAHCDWSADNDIAETGKYKFEVSIKKIKEYL